MLRDVHKDVLEASAKTDNSYVDTMLHTNAAIQLIGLMELLR